MTKSCVLLCLLVLCTAFLPKADADTAQADANSAFQKGEFGAAQTLYSQIASQDPANFGVIVRLGYLALLGNDFDAARKWLNAAQKLNPASPIPADLMAEAAYRQDDFAQAATLYRAIGANDKAEQMASFAGQTPYRMAGQKAITLKFVVTDPLPVVQVSVNGSAPANFFIDTGASELTLDTDFAKKVGARLFGTSTGTYAGGKQASYSIGRVEKVTLGGTDIQNIPVVIMPVRPLSKIFGGLPIDGIVGTVFLYHFLATLDYPNGQMLLQPKAEARRAAEDAKRQGDAIVPFWMAGDHFMVAHGTINGGTSTLFFVDTGLAGGGFSGPEATLTAAGITLDHSQAGEGTGGGGKVEVIPFTVDTLTLGSVTERHVPGYYTGPFAFSDTFGFHLSGLISHSFFRPYALTLDFTTMRYYLAGKNGSPVRQ